MRGDLDAMVILEGITAVIHPGGEMGPVTRHRGYGLNILCVVQVHRSPGDATWILLDHMTIPQG